MQLTGLIRLNGEGIKMFGMPIEVITLLLSVLGGAVMKMWAQAQNDRADQQKMLMQQFSASEDSVEAARSYDTPNAQWIRRFLVVSFMGMAMFILDRKSVV